jgi:hypothetical protein
MSAMIMTRQEYASFASRGDKILLNPDLNPKRSGF